MDKQLSIGLTGGIGSGKTTIAKIFQSMGYPVYFADTRAKYLMVNNQKLIASVQSLFGEDIYTNNKLNRAKLGNIVFNDKAKLEQLNQLVHPAVARDYNDWRTKQRSNIVFKEAAILFETGSYKAMDLNILVTCPVEERIKRVIKRDNSTKEEVLSRMNNQWPEEKKIKLADYTINNSGKVLIMEQIIAILFKLNKNKAD